MLAMAGEVASAMRAERGPVQYSLSRRLEGLLWLTRPPILLDSVFYVVCGWSVSAGQVTARTAAALGSVWLARATGIIINDVIDYPKDKETAPLLPLPSGVVTVRGAVGLSLLLGAGALALGFAAAGTFGGFLAIAFTYCCTLAIAVCYSAVKGAGLLASLLMSAQTSFAGVVGWLAAGAGRPGIFALVFLALTLFGVRQNLLAGLRDIDKDPAVGNLTTAVRLGPATTVRWVLVLSGLTALPLLAVSALRGNLPGAALCTAGGVISLASISAMTAAFTSDQVRTRESRSRALRGLARRCYVTAAAFAIAVQPLLGLAIWLAHFCLDAVLGPLYHARIAADWPTCAQARPSLPGRRAAQRRG
jgi:4-hydroxybenzoate polyprenyltransferase